MVRARPKMSTVTHPPPVKALPDQAISPPPGNNPKDSRRQKCLTQWVRCGYKVPFFDEPQRQLPTIGTPEYTFIVRTDCFLTCSHPRLLACIVATDSNEA
jgi:hypothetical protein